MAMNKDDVFDFEKKNPNLRKVSVGLGWKARQTDGPEFDLDASAVILGKDEKLLSTKHACYFNNKLTADHAVQSMGDNLTGGTSKGKDDETINVDLAKLDDKATQIVFWVTVYDAARRKQSFEMLDNAYIRLYETETGNELCRFDLNDKFILETAVEIAELSKVDGTWQFKAIGKGHTKSIGEAFNMYR